jgi:hypothetical protein
MSIVADASLDQDEALLNQSSRDQRQSPRSRMLPMVVREGSSLRVQVQSRSNSSSERKRLIAALHKPASHLRPKPLLCQRNTAAAATKVLRKKREQTTASNSRRSRTPVTYNRHLCRPCPPRSRAAGGIGSIETARSERRLLHIES